MGGLPLRSDASRGVIRPLLRDDAPVCVGRTALRDGVSGSVYHAAKFVPRGYAGSPPPFPSSLHTKLFECLSDLFRRALAHVKFLGALLIRCPPFARPLPVAFPLVHPHYVSMVFYCAYLKVEGPVRPWRARHR